MDYKEEVHKLIDQLSDHQVLPEKMKWNLESIENYGFFKDMASMFRTVAAVLGKEYE